MTPPLIAAWLAAHPDLTTVGRPELYALFAQMGLDTGAEIGVERGDNAAQMLEANPRLSLLCVDPWLAYKEYRDYRALSRLNRYYDLAQQAVAPYGKRCRLVRAFTMDAVREVDPGSLGFCYIDGNHEFDYAMTDIIEWSRRVRSGGIVAGHDYCTLPGRRVQVIEAVTAYRQAHRIRDFWVVGGQCPNEVRVPASWFWVKP